MAISVAVERCPLFIVVNYCKKEVGSRGAKLAADGCDSGGEVRWTGGRSNFASWTMVCAIATWRAWKFTVNGARAASES